MFLVTGIQKGFTDFDFIEELQTTVQDKLKVITKRQCRNPSKENWLLQAPPKIAKWFLKKRSVHFDLMRVFIEEYINLAMCFKCSYFDHVRKYCTQKECCYKCAGEHESIGCKEENFKCPDCIKIKYKNFYHSARDIICPVYQRRLERYKNNINYGEDF